MLVYFIGLRNVAVLKSVWKDNVRPESLGELAAGRGDGKWC